MSALPRARHLIPVPSLRATPGGTSYPVPRLQICEQNNIVSSYSLGGVCYAVVITGAPTCTFRPMGGSNAPLLHRTVPHYKE